MWYTVVSGQLQENGGILMQIKDYLTVKQVARQIGLSEYRIRELIREKQIRATKIGQWKLKPADLKVFIKSRTNR